jgi:hypothetical protein
MANRYTIRTAAISSAATILVILLLLCVWLREPLYIAYKMRTEFGEKQRKLLYHTNHKHLATELRRFATERRWDNEGKKATPDFYYGDDPALPPALKALGPSWVEINDDRIDVGCGGFVREQGHSFGISVWREGLAGSGVKKLEEGMWFFSDDEHIPGRFHFP